MLYETPMMLVGFHAVLDYEVLKPMLGLLINLK